MERETQALGKASYGSECLCDCIVFYRRFLITHLVRTLRLNTFIGVVAMVPHTPYPEGTVFFVVEKPGLDVAHMGGNDEELVGG